MKKTSFFSFFPPYLDCEVIFAILSYVKNGNCIIMVLKNPLPNVRRAAAAENLRSPVFCQTDKCKVTEASIGFALC